VRRFLVFLLLAVLASSCGPSYPKDKVAESVVSLCQREYGITVQAQMLETTLAVQVSIPGLVEELMKQAASAPQEVPVPIFVEGKYQQQGFHFQFLSRGSFIRIAKEKPERENRSPERDRSKALKMLDQVSTAMRRVALSTDALLEFYLLIARDPGPTSLDLVFSGHLDDLKRVQYLDISLGELQKRSRVLIRPQPEVVARQVVSFFLDELTERPLPQLLNRYAAPSKRFRDLFPKILQLAVDLQGREKELLGKEWLVRQISNDQVLVYVSLQPLEQPGALLFVVQLREGQGSLFDIERLETPALPAAYQKFGPPETWKNAFYFEPIVLVQFLSEQIAKRVLSEFEPIEPQEESSNSRKGTAGSKPPPQPATNAEITRALLETSAYVLHSYRFGDFKELTVTDAMNGTHWSVSAKDLSVYRRRNAPNLQPLP